MAKTTRPRTARGGKKGDTEASVLRREQALALRIRGLSFRQIGKITGTSHVTAYFDVEHALEEQRAINRAKAEQLVELEIRRLDDMVDALWDQRTSPDASRTLLKINERRSRLLGLDKPIEVETTDKTPLRDASDEELLARYQKLVTGQ